jgi:hypothetical protein
LNPEPHEPDYGEVPLSLEGFLEISRVDSGNLSRDELACLSKTNELIDGVFLGGLLLILGYLFAAAFYVTYLRQKSKRPDRSSGRTPDIEGEDGARKRAKKLLLLELNRLQPKTRAMGKSYLRWLGLDGEWTEENVEDFLRKRNVTPYWSEENGLVFKPKVVGNETRRRMQEILGIHGRDEAKQLRLRLKQR